MQRIILILSICCFFIVSSTAHAVAPRKKTPKPLEPANAEATSEPAVQEPKESCEDGMCKVLDFRRRPSHRGIGEFDVYFGDYLGDSSRNTWCTGGHLYYHINHMFSVGAEYVYAPLSVDSSSSFGASVTNKNTHFITAQGVFNNEAALAFGKTQVPLDLFLTFGGGMVNINTYWKWVVMIGGGLKVYVGPEWLALRFDVNSYIHPTPIPSGDSIDGDVAFLIGMAMHFPNKHADTRSDQ